MIYNNYYFKKFFILYLAMVLIVSPVNASNISCFVQVSIFLEKTSDKISIYLQPSRVYVHSVDDFYVHMHVHVMNVKRLANVIYTLIQRDPERWKPVFFIPPEVVVNGRLKQVLDDFMELHDASKVRVNKLFLKKIYRKQVMIGELYSIYGKSFQQMTDRNKKVIRDLNEIDSLVMFNFIQKNQLAPWEEKFLKEVEKLADGVERGSNVVTAEEMAKIPYKESDAIEQMILKAVHSYAPPEEIVRLQEKYKMAMGLEEMYAETTIPYAYYRNKTKQYKIKLREMGYNLKALDKFSVYRLIDEFERIHGEVKNLDDTGLKKMIKDFFFKHPYGKSTLKGARKNP